MARSRPNNGPSHYVAGGTRVALHAAPDLIAANSVALPEIRIESEDDARLEEVAASVSETGGLAIRQSAGRLSVTLESGDGRESLVLANSLAEKHPGLSITPRFLRIVERPAG